MTIAPAATGTVLHLDGGTRRLDATPFAQRAGWQEQQASLADLHGVADASVEAVFCSHGIERLYPHQVPAALQHCLRVLKPEGFLLLQCTDLKAAAKLIAADNYTTPVYQGPHGPMAAIDIVYGHRASIAAGQTELAHHCGFTGQSLMATLKEAGFQQIAARELPDHFDLWALATKATWSEDALKASVAALFPGRS